VNRCIRWLKASGYLDDRQFAAALTRDRLRFSPRSPFLVQRELREKKVGSSVAEAAVRDVMDEEGLTPADLARTAAAGWVRKQSSSVRGDLIGERFSPEREKARRRLYGFLARRGFIGEAAQAGMEAGEEKARDMEV
jgi:regulatory protein